MDATAWVATAGIFGTLLAPVISEMVRRKSVRKERLLELRLEAYADLLKIGTRFVNNATELASMHDVDITEPDEKELHDLLAQVRLVASDDVAKHVKTFTKQVARFHSDVWMARFQHRGIALRNPEDDLVEGVKSVDRVEFGRKADAIRDAFKALEAAIRKDVQA